MKFRFILILLLTITASLVKAQDYEIISFEPTVLTAGADNNVKIVFNQKLAVEDTLEWAEIDALNDEGFIDEYYTILGDYFDNDSVYYASCYIPKGRVHDNCELVFVIFDYNSGSFVGHDSAYYSGITIEGGIAGVDPEICMVSTDDSNSNMVIWEPEYDVFVESVYIYKETVINDEFQLIGKKSIEENSIFIDENSVNAQNSNRYKIAYTDSVGDISRLSPPHKTLHLLMSMGINGSINLIWEKYEGFEYTTFHIYRGSSKQEMMKIAELASNIFTYSDLAPPLGNLYYQVVVEHPSPCDITQQKSSGNIYSSTKSNYVEYSVVSNEIVQSSEQSIHFYPNPVIDFLTILIENSSNEIYGIEIHDLSGRSVLNYSSLNNGSKINLSDLKCGMYLLTVKSDGINQNKIIVKQ